MIHGFRFIRQGGAVTDTDDVGPDGASTQLNRILLITRVQRSSKNLMPKVKRYLPLSSLGIYVKRFLPGYLPLGVFTGASTPLKTLEQDLPCRCPLFFPSHSYRTSPVLSLCTSFRGINPLISSPSLPRLCT